VNGFGCEGVFGFRDRNYAMHPPALMATWGQIETFENTFLNLYRRLSLPGLMLRGFLAYIEAQNGHIYGLSPPADSAKKGSKPTEVESRPSMTPFTADGPQLRSMYRRLDGLEVETAAFDIVCLFYFSCVTCRLHCRVGWTCS
jgi:hypothetical protein